MMLDKEKVILTVNQLSSQFSIDELLDRLIFIDKVAEGIEDIRKGQSHTEAEARERLSKWLK